MKILNISFPRVGVEPTTYRFSASIGLQICSQFLMLLSFNIRTLYAVPEITVQGRLATLQLSLDAAQYRVVRGVLAHNLAEPCTELLEPPVLAPSTPGAGAAVWIAWSLQLDLQDVCVELRGARGAPPLANINFIKSKLLIESYSDQSQDIDLVSQVNRFRLLF